MKKFFQKIGLITKERCQHKHYFECKYIQQNTPMIQLLCHDCGFDDRGPVIGPPDMLNDWAGVVDIRP
jgi:hypothetical protein